MYLKTLTIRGFKSFASATSLRLEPGITCVVGPNGSGKSNVVDAIAWVLGEQGARSLRGGAMADVIFAGTPERPALGRAEVTLTIDNADGALPIDYTEVAVSRLLYRSGESEYAINGSTCRLLDVQELLSDSGIGRELHVIVGQGQLDAVLGARPEERRAYIEEAAGVLKHRKRKEKALRKLDAMSGNLARLTDLTAELRRQLTPLGRQADAARRAAVVQAVVRDARARLLADDVATVLAELAAQPGPDCAADLAPVDLTAEVERWRATEVRLEQDTVAATTRLAAWQEAVQRLTRSEERLHAVALLAAERAHHLEAQLPPPPGELDDPARLEAQALEAEAQERDRLAALAGFRVALTTARTARGRAEEQLASADQALRELARAEVARRERLARLSSDTAALRSRLAAGAESRERLAAAHREAAQRAADGARRSQELQGELAGQAAQRARLLARHEELAEALAGAEAHLNRVADAERRAEQQAAAAAARGEALALALTRGGPAGELLADPATGVLGPLSTLLEVATGWEAALAVALGADEEAVAVAGFGAATTAHDLLRAAGTGRVRFLVGDPGHGEDRDEDPDERRAVAPAGSRWAVELVSPPAAVAAVVARVLRDVVAVADLQQAREIVIAAPHLVAVTRDGELISGDRVVAGQQGGPSQLEIAAEAERAAQQARAATAQAGVLAADVVAAREQAARCRAEVETGAAELASATTAAGALDRELARVAATARSAAEEATRLEQAVAAAATGQQHDQGQLTAAEQRLAAEQAETSGHGGAAGAPRAGAGVQAGAEDAAVVARDEALRGLASAREAETEAHLAVRGAEERLAAVQGSAARLRAAAVRAQAARETATARATRREGAAQHCRDLARLAGALAVHAQRGLHRSVAGRDEESTATAARDGELLAARARSRELAQQLERHREQAHRAELLRAELASRLEALRERAAQEFATTPEDLVAEFGPHLPVPPDPSAEPAGAPPAAEEPYVRAEQEQRAEAAARRLAQIGRVNPLALEEFQALQERQAFLATQLEDLQRARRELLTIVRDVDSRIQEAFRTAFDDTAREFSHVFATLFPGGQGRLELTDPDLDVAGVEVHARPAGKKVSRLSLLSGGERSLAALALLLAIFRARPSPFYVLDEVEAALDDHNLGRLLESLQELRGRSQLIVVTHQKRTMEIADALYGVSMRGDGVTTVVSQRLRSAVPA